MIRHILLFSFRSNVTNEGRRDLLEALRGLPRRFPDIRAFELGRNESQRDDAFDYGMTMTFDDATSLEEYLNSDAHETFVASRFRPLIERRAIVSLSTEHGELTERPAEGVDVDV